MKIVIVKDVEYNLEDKDAALIQAILLLTVEIKRLVEVVR